MTQDHVNLTNEHTALTAKFAETSAKLEECEIRIGELEGMYSVANALAVQVEPLKKQLEKKEEKLRDVQVGIGKGRKIEECMDVQVDKKWFFMK